jgi:hypothetical protein
MNPITHLLVGWGVANIAPLKRRERTCVTFSGVAPDLDGLGILVDAATRDFASPTAWWGTYHHILGHNIAFGMVLCAATCALAERRASAVILALVSFHLHLLGDIVGARGPDGEQWPIPYLLPFSDSWQLVWSGQWELNAWPNFAITALLLSVAFFLAWRRGYSPLELISWRADRAFVGALRSRFGSPRPTPGA